MSESRGRRGVAADAVFGVVGAFPNPGVEINVSVFRMQGKL